MATSPNYAPDFIARDNDGIVWIIETKGREELDLPQKMARLKQWPEDAASASTANGGITYRFLYVDQTGFERHKPATLAAPARSFIEYQTGTFLFLARQARLIWPFQLGETHGHLEARRRQEPIQ
jgi:hypothetical protein